MHILKEGEVVKKVDNYKFITQGSISGISGEVFIKSLERYESTGLTPQQIKDMQFCLREKSRECAELRRRIRELEKRDGKDVNNHDGK